MKSIHTLFVLLIFLSFSSRLIADPLLALSIENIPPAFTANYSVNIGGMSMGKLDVKLTQDDESNWTYHSESSATGIAAVFVGSKNVTDTAKLALLGDTIRPTFYERIRITKDVDKSERVFYRWDTQQAQTQYKDRKLDIALNDLTTDKFTLQLLIMANINSIPEKMTLPIISKAKLRQYDIVKVGEELLQTTYGERDAIIVERIKDDSSYKIWADLNNYGLPLQIERIKQGKTEYIVKLKESSLFTQSQN